MIPSYLFEIDAQPPYSWTMIGNSEIIILYISREEFFQKVIEKMVPNESEYILLQRYENRCSKY